MSLIERLLLDILSFFEKYFLILRCHCKCCDKAECDCSNAEEEDHKD
jgi:hypothetical protein